ncbi:MAG: TonB-dependent receptor domain-containing protein [Pseudomonadales bacterium]
MEFEDTNVSPELAVNHHLNDNMSIFFAYKEGFKSGGIDNSALPTGMLRPANPDFPGFLIYQSEEAEGFEVGMKGNFLDSALRLNATLFTYEYSDLQVQLFNSSLINFQTFNASALETSGFEFDALWHTGIEGLTVRTAWAWTETEYSKDFINATSQNLKGESGAGNAEVAGYVGFTLDLPMSGSWRYSFSADTRYTGEYPWTATLNPFMQDKFWLVDVAVSIYSDNGQHRFNLIGRNLGDEIYVIGGGAAPGRCVDYKPPAAMGALATCAEGPPANSLDQNAITSLGRTVALEYRFAL